jgi:hypothetical protein
MFVTNATKGIDSTKIENYTYDLWQFSGKNPTGKNANLYVILKADDNLDNHFTKILNKYPELKKYCYSESRVLISKVLLDETQIIDNDGVFIFVDYQKNNEEYEYKPFLTTTKNLIGKDIRAITSNNTGNVYKIVGIGNKGIYIHYPHNDRIYFSLEEAFELFVFLHNWSVNIPMELWQYSPFGEKK